MMSKINYAIRSFWLAKKSNFSIKDYVSLFQLFFLTTQDQTTFQFRGIKFNFTNLQDFIIIFFEVFILECYYVPHIESYEYIVDMGANIGVTTLYLKHKCKNAKIWSIEAAPNNFKKLEENINQNGFEAITCIQKAISNVSGETIKLFYNASRTGQASLSSSRAESEDYSEVETLGFQELIDSLPQVDILKMDVEGTENILFSEALDLSKVKNLIIEYHNFSSIQGKKLPRLISELERNGFKYSINGRFDQRFNPIQNQDINIFASKMEK